MAAPQGFAGLSALIELPQHAAPVSIRATFGFLLRTLGQPKDTPREALGDSVSAASAISVLQLLSANLEDVSLQDAAAALCAAPDVSLDALIGLSCLLSTGSNKDKLQLCFWTLDRDSSGSLDLQQVLGLIPAAQQAAAAARILLQETTLQGLSEEAADPQAAATRQQGCAVLRDVLSRAFAEADPQGTGLIQPGEQLTQLLFAAAAQLTSLMVGAIPLSHEGTAYGSSRASSASITPTRSASASPFRPHHAPSDRQPAAQPQQQHVLLSQPPHAAQQQTQHSQLQAPAAAAGPSATHSMPPTPGAAAHGAAHSTGSAGPPALADILIMDKEGGMLHYQSPVNEAAAAACMGRVPTGCAGSGGMRVYGPHPASRGNSRHSLKSAAGHEPQQQHVPLAPASSLLEQLELLEAQQQQQQQQQQQRHAEAVTGSEPEAALFLTPNGTVSVEESRLADSGDGTDSTLGPGSAAHGPFAKHQWTQRHQQQHQHQQQQQDRAHRPTVGVGPRAGGTSPDGSASNSLRRIFVGSPFGTISESVRQSAGGTASSGAETGGKDGQGGGSRDAGQEGDVAPATAAGAITHTATNVMATVQSNVIAVVVKLLLHCGVCFLVTMMVALGDAAIVTGLHLGAKLPLSVSFAVAVAANLALVLMLLGLLVVARVLNASSNSRLAAAANSPEAQQLDQILETMKAAVQALKTAEQQQQAGLALHPTGGSASQRFTGSHFLASRTSSMRDVEQGRPGAAGGGQAGVGGPLAVAGKLRAVWSAVGKVAGFLPPAPEPGASEGALAGPFGSSVVLQEGGVLAGVHQHSSTSWGASSGSEAQGARPPGAGRPPSPPARQLRAAAATAAPQSPVALREAYPQL